MERAVDIFFLLVAVNFLFVLLMGGTRLAIGSLRLSEYHLWAPLFFLLVFAAAKAWLQGKRMGTSASGRLRSAKFLFLTILLVYNVNQRTVDSGDTLPARYLP